MATPHLTQSLTAEFHQAFGHPVRQSPIHLERTEALLCLKLIEEEFRELANAMFPGITDDHEGRALTDLLDEHPYDYAYEPDLIEIADAIGDLDVTVSGAGLRYGIDMAMLAREVQASNMTKLGADGKPIYHESGPKVGKIAKGPLFREPNIEAVLGL